MKLSRSDFLENLKFVKDMFTPLEKTPGKVEGVYLETDAGLMSPSALTVRERGSLTGFTRFRILPYFFILAISGCATLSHMDELLTLKSVADSQKEIEKYLTLQEKGFNKLLDDVKNNRLKVGITKKYIIATYSEPILVKDQDKDQAKGEILLYRHPTQYFKSDRIYLYFNDNHRLIYWEIKNADS